MFKSDEDLSDDGWRQHYGGMLPAVMNQEPESNNQKILDIICQLANNAKNNLLSISDQVLISNASGQTLTDLAADWGVTRIDDDDDFLRFELRLQWLKGRTGVTTNDLKNIISYALDIDVKSFDVIGDENPEEIELTNVIVNIPEGPKAELKRRILLSSIEDILAPEYKLKDMQYAKEGRAVFYYAAHAVITPMVNVKEDRNTYRDVGNQLYLATHAFVTPMIQVKEMA